MKKELGALIRIICFSGFLALTLIACGSNNNGTNTTDVGSRQGAGNYVDANGDGICDNTGRRMSGMGQGGGSNFVDENNDGICDRTGRRMMQQKQ